MTKQVPAKKETPKMFKQIIFKTLSATPLLKDFVKSNPSTATEESSRERTLSLYNGLTNFPQEIGDVQSEESVLNVQEQGNVQEIPKMSKLPNDNQFTGISLGSSLFRSSSLPSTKFMDSIQQGEDNEAFEDSDQSIHVHGSNGNFGFSLWSDWKKCSVSCGRGLQMRTRSCISTLNGMEIDHSCLGPKVQTRRCRLRRCPGKRAI